MNEDYRSRRGLAVPKRERGVKTVSHVRAPKQERAMAERLGGRCTPASGSRDVKGDVRVEGVLRLECKNTTKQSFSVTREMIEKIEQAAINAGELPAVQIDFIDARGNVEASVAVVPCWVLDSLAQGRGEG